MPIARDDNIALFDILLSIMMNSRLGSAEKIRTVWNDREHMTAAERMLGQIAPAASLLDEVVPWNHLADLFNSFCAIRGVGPAVATKILHKKRPALIPIIDSVMIGYFKAEKMQTLPDSSPIGNRIVVNLRFLREQLMSCREAIESLCEQAASAHYACTPLRVLEVLIWIEREPIGYYRT